MYLLWIIFPILHQLLNFTAFVVEGTKALKYFCFHYADAQSENMLFSNCYKTICCTLFERAQRLYNRHHCTNQSTFSVQAFKLQRMLACVDSPRVLCLYRSWESNTAEDSKHSWGHVGGRIYVLHGHGQFRREWYHSRLCKEKGTFSFNTGTPSRRENQVISYTPVFSHM